MVVLSDDGGTAVRVDQSDASGDVRFSDLKPGHYRVLARAAASGERWFGEDASGQDVVIESGKTVAVDMTLSKDR